MALRNHGIGTRTFGIEIECIGLSIDRAAAALNAAGIPARADGRHLSNPRVGEWLAKWDGSVGASGCEVVSPVLSGEAGIEAIEKVCRALVAAGATVNQSCGLHVHVGARDLDLGAWKRLVKTYAKFEDTIDLLVAPSRRGNRNHYCQSIVRPCGATTTERVNATMAEIDLARDIDGIYRALGQSRYRKLNVASFWRHGTVEFRQHQGTVDARKATMWVRFVVAMVEAATASGSVQERRDNGQTAAYRFKWLFNATVQGEVRRFWSKRLRHFTREQRAGRIAS